MPVENGGIWINKFISESGFCSRREADKYVDDGLVTVNRVKVGKVTQVFPSDIVYVGKQLIAHRKEEDIVFIALNKPAGIVCTTELKIKDNIVDFVNHKERIFPVGRLDKDSQGLIFMTNNGDIVNKILRAGNNHEKEYLVTVNKPLSQRMIDGMGNGVPILGEITKKCKITAEGTHDFRIILVQGLNRQIRRMCEYFGYEVVKLERVRIMNITLKGISIGKWRNLTQAEMNDINKLTKASISDINNTDTRLDNPSTSPKKELRKAKEIVKSIKPSRGANTKVNKFSKDGEAKKDNYKPTDRDEKTKSTNKPSLGKKTDSVKFNKLDKSEKAPSVPRVGKSRKKITKATDFKSFRNAKKKG